MGKEFSEHFLQLLVTPRSGGSKIMLPKMKRAQS
jgi:hypothetical protein